MQIDLIGKLASAALTLIVTLIQRRTAGKPRLLVWGPQPASYAIPNRPPPPTESDSGAAPVPATQPFPAVINLHSTTTAIQNVGGRQATAIQIAFPLRPRALRIEPPLKYEESTLPGGEYLVELSTLAPKEWIAVNALWEGFSFLPIYVRSAAGPAVEQPLQLQRVLPLWVRVLLWGLLLLGTWTAIYWALRVLALPYLRVWIR